MVTPRPPDYYRERSRRLLARVDQEVDDGELDVACEMLWGAAALGIKAVAQQRGWPHGEHRLLRMAVDQLIRNGAPPYLLGQYLMASDFHQGFYGDRIFSMGQIRRAKELVSDFIRTLESVA